MAECDWIFLCDYAFIAAPQKVSAVGIFDTMYSSSLPTVHDRAFVVIAFVGEPGENPMVKLEIIGPNGTNLFSVEVPVTLPDSGTGHLMIELRLLKMDQFGRHAIQVDLGDGHPKSTWFTLKQAPVP